MRILTMILAILCLLATTGLGGFTYSEFSKRVGMDAVDDAEKVSAQVEKETGSAPPEAAMLGKVKTTLYMWLGLAGLSLVLLVLLFVKKGVLPVGAVVAVLAIASFALLPDQQDFKRLGMVIAIPGLLGAVFAILSDKLRQKNAAA